MKARVKKTGRIIVVEKAIIGYAECAVANIDGFPAQNFYAKSELEFLPDKEEVTIEGWAVRWHNGEITLFQKEPIRLIDGDTVGWTSQDGCKLFLTDDALPSVTTENSPLKVKITITPIEE